MSEGCENVLQLVSDDGANVGEVLGDADRAVLGLTLGMSKGADMDYHLALMMVLMLEKYLEMLIEQYLD